MKVLITGITGFVGLHLAEYLLAAGDEVIGSALEGTWPRHTPPSVVDHVELLTWDIREQASGEFYDRVGGFGIEGIYHLAAISVPARCAAASPAGAPSEEATAVNLQGTGHALQIALRLRTRPRFYFASSSYVYGAVSNQQPIDETHPTRPRNAYGLTKYHGEGLIRGYVDEVDAVIGRSFQHIGPRQERVMMLPEWVSQFVETRDPVRVRNLNTWIDVTDVRDAVRAQRLLMTEGRRHEVYNIGSGRAIRTGDVFHKLREQADPDRPFEETSPGERFQPIADPSKLAGELGWRPEISLEDTIRDTLQQWKR